MNALLKPPKYFYPSSSTTTWIKYLSGDNFIEPAGCMLAQWWKRKYAKRYFDTTQEAALNTFPTFSWPRPAKWGKSRKIVLSRHREYTAYPGQNLNGGQIVWLHYPPLHALKRVAGRICSPYRQLVLFHATNGKLCEASHEQSRHGVVRSGESQSLITIWIQQIVAKIPVTAAYW